MKFKSTLVFGLMAACLSFATPASATLVNGAWQSAAFAFSDVNDDAELSFNGFDASLGSLVGVIIEFTLNESLSENIFNTGSHSVLVGRPNQVSSTSTITASGPLGLSVVNQLSTPGFFGTVPGAGLTTVATVNTPANFLVGPASISGNPVALNTYIGGVNTVVIDVAGFGTQSGSLPPGAFAGYVGESNGIVYLQYVYDIPEPGSIALFGLGLIGLAVWRHRKA
jgi:hypothetical protein